MAVIDIEMFHKEMEYQQKHKEIADLLKQLQEKMEDATSLSCLLIEQWIRDNHPGVGCSTQVVVNDKLGELYQVNVVLKTGIDTEFYRQMQQDITAYLDNLVKR